MKSTLKSNYSNAAFFRVTLTGFSPISEKVLNCEQPGLNVTGIILCIGRLEFFKRHSNTGVMRFLRLFVHNWRLRSI